MKKIVVIIDSSERSESYEMLNACLTLLFPECEIEIVSNGRKALEMYRKLQMLQSLVGDVLAGGLGVERCAAARRSFAAARFSPPIAG